ncbi:RNA-binding KH domain-containing protein RCF3 [Primulina eburnea]|uniref:RNA-binding KH domain-containing protein RCF3 n=1 Tax=Primulina eburnea TaxID=1245227 RepID=UPI003C6C87FC
MERSRSKRYYYDQDYESETLHSRSKPRYGNNSHGGGAGGHHYAPSYPRRSSVGGGGGGGGRKMQDPSLMVTTSYRILCHDVKAGGVIGKSGSIIKAIRQHTGAWINVHELIPGDEERIIEISDTRRRDPDGRLPNFSPAQEALFLIHERILETEMGGYGGFGEDVNEEYGNRGGGNGGKMVTRLVVSRIHVGSLLGKGGKIIEQMRMETKTHIRVLPRDHTLPRCVAMSEEIVQVVGEMNAVKNAIAIISSRLRESQHRDRNNFSNQLHSPERFGVTDDDFRLNGAIARRSSAENTSFGPRYSAGSKGNNYSSRSSGYALESGPGPLPDNAPSYCGDEIVFRIFCPVEKVECVVGESDGIMELLQNEIGVNVDVADPVAGSDERIITILSDEGPDDELFPAQEALLHIQTRIVDIAPEKENIITTRLLLQSDEIGCLKDSSLLDKGKMGGANVEILPRGKLPAAVLGSNEIIQIVGEIKAAREALIEVTSRVRSYIYREFLEKGGPAPTISISSHMEGAAEPESASSDNTTPSTHSGNGTIVSNHQSTSNSASVQKTKDIVTLKPNEVVHREDTPSILNRITVPLVTRSTLEVVLPPHTAAKLVTKSKKLAFISELSGATVKLIEDGADASENIIQISGTPDQAEKAQSLLQGFILSTEEDGP